MAMADDNVSNLFFGLLLLKQSFLKTTDQQSPAIQQFEETIYHFLLL